MKHKILVILQSVVFVSVVISLGCATGKKTEQKTVSNNSDASRTVASAEAKQQKLSEYKSTITSGTTYSYFINGLIELGLADLETVNHNLKAYTDRHMKLAVLAKSKPSKSNKEKMLFILAQNRESIQKQFAWIPDLFLPLITKETDLAEQNVQAGRFKEVSRAAIDAVVTFKMIKKDVSG